jgi:transketolase
MIGKYSMEDLENFRQWGSVTPGHPEVDFERGVENTSGPLGQGHTMAVGAAIAERFLCARFGEWMSHKTYAFISDGGIQEEIAQGAGRIAGNLGLSNLIMFYDANNIQLSTKVEQVTVEDTAKKYEAWGWKVITINGNDADEIRSALKAANKETEMPTLIIGNTLMGKGARDANGESFEDKVSTHGQPLTAAGADIKKTIENLGGNPESPFQIFPEVKEYYEQKLEEKRQFAAAKQAEQKEWEAANQELAAKFKKFFSGDAPEIDWAAIEQKADQATRAASSTVLMELAKQVENMIVSSADLSNSDKTDGFIKGGARDLVKGDFTGAFLQAGVAELTMAAICNGIALHGGVIAACGTFFVFSDYMKPAVRLSALMEVPVKYIWTHDAFRVGEDGPTHQPVEQEAQIRLLEKMKNHSHKQSLLALRPADVHEATVAWKMAMENTNTPTAMIFSRQNIKNLEGGYERALKAEKGAYIVEKCEGTPDIVLLASGSEVATLVAGAELLKAKNIKVQIVSVISEGLFRQQSAEYQNEVLPKGIKRFGMTAGLPVTLEGLVGENGKVFGLESFGFSAPAGVLDKKFGYTAENVEKEVMELLG